MNAFSTCLLLALLNFAAPEVEGSKDASANFRELRRYYLKWNSGPAGSRSYFKKILYSQLVEMIGQEIKTDYDYAFWSFEGNTFEAKFKNGKWLVIKGEISEREALKKLEGTTVEEKAKVLFSISGRIKRFRLSETEGEGKIFLVLEDIKIETSL